MKNVNGGKTPKAYPYANKNFSLWINPAAIGLNQIN